MEENEQILDNENKEKEDEIKETEEIIDIKNEEDEEKQLLSDKNKNEEINIIKTKEDNNKENKVSLINTDQNFENQNQQLINNNNQNQQKNLIIGDYIITIQYTKLFHIPYFIFGNMFNFFCPCHKFKSEKINLSQMPTPPFAIVITQCKKKYLFIFKFK